MKHTRVFGCGSVVWGVSLTLAFAAPTVFGQAPIRADAPFDSIERLWFAAAILLVSALLYAARCHRRMRALRHCVRTHQAREKDLQHREQWFEATLKSIGDAVITTDTAGKITFINRTAEMLTGFCKADALGKTIGFNSAPSHSAGHVFDSLSSQAAQEEIEIRLDEDLVLLGRQGAQIPIEYSGAPIMAEDGGISGVVLVFKDITERQLAEERLRQANDALEQRVRERTAELAEASEELRILGKAVETMKLGVTIVDVAGRILYVNPADADMHGYAVDDLIGQQVELYAPSELRQPMTVEQVERMQGWVRESSNIRQDQSVFPVHLTSSVVRNGAGKPLAIVTTCEDITERAATEKALANERNLLRTLIDSIPDYIYVKDTRHQFILVNQASVTPQLPTVDDFVGITDFDLFPHDIAEHLTVEEARILRTGQPLISHEEITPDPDTRQERWFSTTKVPLRNSQGEITGLVGISRDISAQKRAEKIVRDNERFLNSVFDAIQDGIAVHSTDLTLLRTNRWMEQRYARNMPLVGQKCYAAFHHQETPCQNCPALAAINTGKPHRAIMPCVLGDSDETRWMDIATFPLVDDKNRISGVIEYIKDISEQKKAEKTVEQERQRLLELLENLPVYVYLQAPDASIRFANRNFRDRFGEPERGQCHKLLWGRGDLWEDSPTYQVFYTGQPQAWEWNHYPSGKIYQVYGYAFTDFDGSPLALELGIDITERKHMEQALQQEHRLLAQKVAERTAELSAINQQLQQEIEERERIRIELQHSQAAALQAKQLAEDARRSAEDARRSAEDARQAAESASQAKSEFLANMSHELRTPLNAVLGYAQILKQADNLTERQRESLDTIHTSGQHLLNLINEILDLSKIEAGQMELDQHDFHLPDFLRRITDMIRIRAEEKGLTFAYDADASLPVGIRADEKKLRQVLINLLGNAIKFTEKGIITLRISDLEFEISDLQDAQSEISNQKSQIKNLKFEISDTGIGIEQARLDDIFLPFQQVGESRYTSEGTGLGLTISRKLVAMLGGELDVSSTLGAGSCFSFRVPVTEAANVQPPAVASERRILGYKGPQKTILVADDRRENRGVVVNVLLPLGFKVLEAENGHECLEHAYVAHPDAILLDLRMPLLDGFETARQIRKQPTLQTIPIIAISASVYDEIRTRSLASGCNLFLTKPLHLDELLNALRAMLELEWIYSAEESEPHPDKPDRIQSAPDIKLSAAEIAEILELAEKGRAKRLLAYFAKLEKQHPESQPQIEELREYVKQFRFKFVIERVHAMKAS